MKICKKIPLHLKRQGSNSTGCFDALAEICNIHLQEGWSSLDAPLGSIKVSPNAYIHTYIRLLTTSPKGLFSANYKEKDENKNIYKLFKVTIANH